MNVGTIVALFIAALSLAVAAAALRKGREDSYTGSLEHQVATLKADLRDQKTDHDRELQELQGTQIQQQRDLDDCKRARDAFEDKNFQLLQEVYDMRKQLDELRRDHR